MPFRYRFPDSESWVVEAFALNCWSEFHEFAVVVPKASEMVFVERVRG